MGRLKTLDDWLEWQSSVHPLKVDLTLERVKKVYHQLFPEGLSFKVVSVAGTNGKGSTATFIESIYQQSGVRVAKFTSPHLSNYNERFSINGKYATDEQICNAFAQIEALRGGVTLTYFEFSTLAALIIFAFAKVEIAILEVGLGGRLDAVNVVDNDLSIITNIAIDHEDYLGNTREQIGFEKAGIMRTNTPCICGETQAPNSLKAHAAKIHALLEFSSSKYSGDITLIGEHQRQNAALAVQAVDALQAFFRVTKAQLESGIRQAKIDARFQIKTLGDKTFILDVAHNGAAVQALARTLAKQPQATLAIFSALKDKNITAMIAAISELIDAWILFPLATERAIGVEQLQQKFSPGDKLTVCQNASAAITQANAQTDCQRVVIFGSFLTVGEAIKILP